MREDIIFYNDGGITDDKGGLSLLCRSLELSFALEVGFSLFGGGWDSESSKGLTRRAREELDVSSGSKFSGKRNGGVSSSFDSQEGYTDSTFNSGKKK